MEQAYQRIIEFSVIGAAFVVQLGFCATLVWWILRTSAAMIREKDWKLTEVYEQRAEAAEEAVRAITTQNERTRRVLDMLNELLEKVRDDTQDS